MGRRPTKVAAIALANKTARTAWANKTARTAWAIMARGTRYKEPQWDPLPRAA